MVIFMSENFWAIFWLIAAIGLFVAEAMTVQFVSIWAALAALVVIFPAYLGVDFDIQLLAFAILTVIFIAISRPFVKKLQKNKPQVNTNARRIVGSIGMITEEVDNIKSVGRVTVSGVSWACQSYDNSILPASTQIEVLDVHGTKLLVRPIEAEPQPVAQPETVTATSEEV